MVVHQRPEEKPPTESDRDTIQLLEPLLPVPIVAVLEQPEVVSTILGVKCVDLLETMIRIADNLEV